MSIPKSVWPSDSKELATALHAKLSIREKNWHKLKNNHDRRAAETISAAIVQLIGDGKRSDTVELLEQGLLWIKREINDPGCPDRQSN